MRNLDKYFKDTKIKKDKLLEFGFTLKGKTYCYEKNILDNHFKVMISISDNTYTSKVMDNETNEEYILVDIDAAYGNYVSMVMSEYEKVIEDVILNCTDKEEVYKSKQSQKIISYVKEKYHDELEFLWDTPTDAIWRNKENNKWYGLVMAVKRNRLETDSEDLVEVLNLRYQKDLIDNLVDNKLIFRGYHMNKKSWISIILDGRVNINKIYKLIDNSYELSFRKLR